MSPGAEVRLAAARAGVDPDRSRAVGDGEEPLSTRAMATEVAGAWRTRRHVIVRCGPGMGVADVADGLADAGVPRECPALAAAGLGTDRERLLYGSVSDLRGVGFGEDVVLVIPHPAALPMDFPWPPTAAP